VYSRNGKLNWGRNETWFYMEGEIMVKMALLREQTQYACSWLKNVAAAVVIVGVGVELNDLILPWHANKIL